MSDTLALISQARQALAEAQTLPDIKLAMERAKAGEAGARAAARVAAQRDLVEVAEQANEAANDAASVRIEAQAKAGELLKQMAERGERIERGSPGMKSQPATSLDDLGVTKSESSRWQQIADVPEPIREEYVQETKAGGGEVTTAGLLRHAEEKAADRWAQTAPVPAENRYRLELSRLAEQAGKVSEFDPEEAARFADDGTALSLETVPGTWHEWVRNFQRARRGLRVVRGES